MGPGAVIGIVHWRIQIGGDQMHQSHETRRGDWRVARRWGGTNDLATQLPRPLFDSQELWKLVLLDAKPYGTLTT